MSHLLLVDDDDSNRLTLSTLLEDDGFTVDVASSFAEAKRLFEGNAPAYDAVLLDHSLGDGYGSDLIPLIRRALPHTKVVAMSGSVASPQLPQTADAELPKGLHFPDFLARLQTVLSSPR